MSAFPATIKALKTQPGGGVAVVDHPFATRDDIKNLAPDSVLVKVKAVGLNPTE